MGLFDKLLAKKEEFDPNELFAPMAGTAVPVSEVPDPAFAQGLLGQGIAIRPTDGRVYAPCSATVVSMLSTGHAISLAAGNGAELLIHVGLETVSLGGNPFTVYVKDGQKVKKGQLLFEADLEAINAAGLNAITPFLVCNADEFEEVSTDTGREVTNRDVVIRLKSSPKGGN